MLSFDRRTRVRLKRLKRAGLAAPKMTKVVAKDMVKNKIATAKRRRGSGAVLKPKFDKRDYDRKARRAAKKLSAATSWSHDKLSRLPRPRLAGKNWKRILLAGVGGLAAVMLLVQIFYPGDRLLPLASIDGMGLGWQTKPDAADKLNAAYAAHSLDVYMGQQNDPFKTVKLADLGVKVENTERLKAMSYPWYLRIVPSSLLWAHVVAKPSGVKPQFSGATDRYIEQHLMPACRQAPVDANLKAEKGEIKVVPAKNGGQCESAQVVSTVKSAQPMLGEQSSVRVDLKELSPAVIDRQAEETRDRYIENIGNAVEIKVGEGIVQIDASEFIDWLDFTVQDNTIVPSVNADRSADFFRKSIAPKVEVPAGLSRVTTLDFAEVSREEGASGVAIDIGPTYQTMVDYVVGKVPAPLVMTRAIPPKVQYTRTYSASDAGLSALLENYARDHKGTFGISLAELSGKKRRASYNGDKQFVTASTYKLFVAYSVLKRVEAGKMDWGANEACFNKMISLSDNPCSEKFLHGIGLSEVTKDAKSMGLDNSTFMKSGGPFTTANDLALFLGFLESGTSLSGQSRDRLLSAMHGNVFRQGIPAGTSAAVADKVGFLNGLLHDAAIVYSPSGTYVLAIMTDGSSWGAIADITRQIETLRAQ